jgi:hypothetical protein
MIVFAPFGSSLSRVSPFFVRVVDIELLVSNEQAQKAHRPKIVSRDFAVTFPIFLVALALAELGGLLAVFQVAPCWAVMRFVNRYGRYRTKDPGG